MRIEQLDYLLSIYETGSFSLAAEKNHITQPTISQSIRNLENELDVKVFTRTRQGVEPTLEGEIVIKKAISILTIHQELKDEINIRSSSVRGTLKLAIVPSICSTILPKTLMAYKEKYPLVNIEIFEKGSFEIEKDILTGNSEVGVIGFNANHNRHKDLEFIELLRSKVKVCVGVDSELSKQKELSVKEIIEYPIVMFKSNYYMNFFVNHLLSPYGDINVLFTSGNTEVAKKIISQGVGIGFFTDLSLKKDPYILNGSLIPIDIKDLKTNSIFASIHSKNRKISRAAEEFIKELEIQAELY
ncbi:LysR family transcriptional regulator [Planococcus salinus]|uniref:LysR family transcriptional regulator n=1 Tax=Planococcus salinus TaxID=1848460 RepID=A0A3M8P7U4_9BACL|nr:LysR family transcriptional regulator [Planococcus salinus]RNF39727.1 LysR family transcriptional regulator [Planococcus salinus]